MGFDVYTEQARGRGQLGPQVLAVPVPLRDRLLRHGVHGHRRAEVRHRPLRRRVPALLAPPGRPADGRRHHHRAAGPGAAPHLRSDGRAQVGDRLRRLRLDRRLLPELHDHAGRRPGHPGRRLHPRLPAAARAGARRPDHAAGADPARRGPQPGHPQGRARLRRAHRCDPSDRRARREPTATDGRLKALMAQIILDRLKESFRRRDPGDRLPARRRMGAHPPRCLGGGGARSCATTRPPTWTCSST